jgi:dihydrofolate synthase/folylpolyglutamate synthase
MSYLDALKEYEGMKPGLSRIKKFLAEIQNPQDVFRSVQIAGTNGKGSTALFLSEILRAHGHKTGLYTSPHLLNVCERIKIDGKDISENVLNRLTNKYLPQAKKHKLTYFEFLTALAFIHFADEEIDIAVLETGLGGRFDATNAAGNTSISIITSISLDHQEILGKTISKIAAEKAGIIKGGAVITSSFLPKAVLSQMKKASKPYLFGEDFNVENVRIKSAFQIFDYKGIGAYKNLKIIMNGQKQVQNASMALFAAELLLGQKMDISAAKKALSLAFISARFERRKVKVGDKKMELIIDGAHNQESIGAFLQSWKEAGLDKKKRTFVFAMMKEKDYKKAVRAIAPLASKAILPRLKSPRALQTQALKKEFLKFLPAEKIIETKSTREALEKIEDGEKAAVLGSFYLAGEVHASIIGNRN